MITTIITNRPATKAEAVRLSLESALRQGGTDPSLFLRQLYFAVEHEVWKELEMMPRDFFTLPPPHGVGATPQRLLTLVRLPSRFAADPEEGAQLDRLRNTIETLFTEPENRTGRPGNSDIVRVSGKDTSGFGNSREYKLRRLKRDRPDLFAKVLNHEMSANAAAIAAGYPSGEKPLTTLRRAWGKLTAAERKTFLAEVARD